MLPDYQTVVVGAGFSGIGAAITLDRAGLGDYLLIEAGDGVGGTWHWNTYPGIAVDIPSFSYQFSFEQRADWSRTYAPGHELKAYAGHCVDKYRIRPKIRFDTKVLAAEFDDERALWRVHTDPGGVVTARFLINAGGVLTVPKLPDIDGVDSFGGVTMHTARWDHGQDLTGRRVAVIGTGASAVQVIPQIAPIVSRLSVFQRTPIWCFPKFDVPLPAPARWAMRLPGGKAVQRLLGRAPAAGLRRSFGSGFPEPVFRVRAVRLRRVVVFRADRSADPPHRALPGAGGPRRRQPRRGHRRGQRPLLRRDDAPTAPAGVLAGQLPAGQQLLLRQERRRAATVEAYWRSRRFALDDYRFT